MIIRVPASAIFILLLLQQSMLFAESVEVDERDVAKETAAAYDKLFDLVDAFEEKMGETYENIFYPIDDESANTVSEAQKEKALQLISAQLEVLRPLAEQPEVDFGRTEDLEKNGPLALLPRVGPIRGLVAQAKWHAKETWDKDPDAAINNLLNVLAAARHTNQESTLINQLTYIACERMCMHSLSELSTKMTPQQRDMIKQKIANLPKTGSLEDALLSEKEYLIGWYKRKLLAALSAWEDEHYGSDGFRFPQDLRLAGVVLLSNTPARISLHNVRQEKSFWLEKGREIHGIRLDKVEYNPARAWITHNGRTAIIDLKEQTIEGRYVPWEVLYSVFIKSDYTNSNLSESEMRKQLIEFGMTPETALDHFDRVEAFYDEAITRLNSPIDEFKEWQDSYLSSFEEGTFGSMLTPAVAKIIEVVSVNKGQYEALETGFALQSQGITALPEDSVFVLTENDNGFTLTPREYVGHENEYNYSLHFGTPPPEPGMEE